VRKILLLISLAPLLVVAGVLVGGDIWARRTAESEMSSAVDSHVAGVGSVETRIDSFPFLWHLLAGGKVPAIEVRLLDVQGYGVGVSELRFTVDDLEVGRAVLTGDVKVAEVGQVGFEATITEAEVRRATGIDVRLAEGQATVAGRPVEVAVTLDGRITMSSGGRAITSLPLPDSGLLPCTPTVRPIAGALVGSCTADHLPALVLAAVT
jgi:hypothetical protein